MRSLGDTSQPLASKPSSAPPRPVVSNSLHCRKSHPDDRKTPDLSLAVAHPRVELRLADGNNRDADEGILQIRCPALMNGYYNLPEATRAALTEDGFYITGDVFRRDGEGFYCARGTSRAAAAATLARRITPVKRWRIRAGARAFVFNRCGAARCLWLVCRRRQLPAVLPEPIDTVASWPSMRRSVSRPFHRGEAKADQQPVVAKAADPILAPSIGPGTRMAVRKIFPSGRARCSPRAPFPTGAR
jgi:hypothetical protein